MRQFFISIIIAIIIFQVGCSGFLKSENMHVKIQSAKYLNPNIHQQSSPVVLVFYQLKSPILFRHSSFSALYTRPSKALGNTLINKEEIEIRPKQKLELIKKISPQANYIGVIAAFRNPSKSRWRQIIPITSNSSDRLIVNLGTQTVTLHLE